MNLHEFKKNFNEKMHFDSQKPDFNFGKQNAYHIIFMYNNCMICNFSLAKTKTLF